MNDRTKGNPNCMGMNMMISIPQHCEIWKNAIFKHDSNVIILPPPSLFSFMIFIFNFIDQRYDVNLKCVIEKKQQV